jgi:hypothetical protein
MLFKKKNSSGRSFEYLESLMWNIRKLILLKHVKQNSKISLDLHVARDGDIFFVFKFTAP